MFTFLMLQKADKKEDIPDDFGSGRMIPTKQVRLNSI